MNVGAIFTLTPRSAKYLGHDSIGLRAIKYRWLCTLSITNNYLMGAVWCKYSDPTTQVLYYTLVK